MLGGASFENSASVCSVKSGQFAFLKLIKVRLSLGWGWISVAQVMIMGRWSDPRVVWVSQVVYGRREREAREMSGEVVCPLEGRRV